MNDEEEEDVGLLFLMQQVDKTDTVSKEEFMKACQLSVPLRHEQPLANPKSKASLR